jgi:hypothetical protein
MTFKPIDSLVFLALIGAALIGCAKNDQTAVSPADSTRSVTTSVAGYEEAAKVWDKVLACKATFDDVVKDKNWKSIHEAGFAIRDELLLLPDASKPLGDHLAKVKDQVKQVGSLAEQLDEAGDAGNGPKVEALAKEMTETLNGIAAHFPAGALPKEATGKANLPAGDHDH